MSKIIMEKNGSVFAIYHEEGRLFRGLITDNMIETYDKEREQLMNIAKNLEMIKGYEKGNAPKEGVNSFLKYQELLDIIKIDVPYISVALCHRKSNILLYLLLNKALTKVTLGISYSIYDFVKVGGLLLAKVTRHHHTEDIQQAYKLLDEMVEWDRVWDIGYRHKRGLIQDELDRYER